MASKVKAPSTAAQGWRGFCSFATRYVVIHCGVTVIPIELLQDPAVFENPDDSKSMAIQRTNLQVDVTIIHLVIMMLLVAER